MALKKSIIETREGFSGQLTAADAYWRVYKITGDKSKVVATIGAYLTKDGQISEDC